MNSQSLYEEALVVRSRLGDGSAFEELYRIYSPRLVAFTERLMHGIPNLAEDVVQETWLSVFKALPKLKADAQFKPWIFRIARDHVFNVLRKRGRMPPMEEVDNEMVALDPESSLDTELIKQHLGSLSVEHREAIILHYMDGFSYEEIAVITGVKIGTVRSRVFYGKQELGKKLKGVI